jgi:proline iminopeptidase
MYARKLFESGLALLLLCVIGSAGAQSPPAAGNFATNAGVKIWYRVEGAPSAANPPLLMIHGGPGATSRPFEKTIGPLLAKQRQVVYMDYRGAGRSERPSSPAQYSFDLLASDADAVRKQLGFERWYVFGHSNGAATAVTYASQYAQRIAGLVLCSPFLGPLDIEMNLIHKVALAPPDKYREARSIYQSRRTQEQKFNDLLDLIDRRTRYRFQYFDPDSSEVLERIQSELATEIGKDLMTPQLMQGLAASGFFQFDAFKSAARLSMPLLVIAGRADSEISIENAMKFAVSVPDGYVAIMERSGHHPYLEETQATAATITTFLSEHALRH